jgi:DNA-binding winged helix-turn-helix (wHTH) protein
MSRVEPEIGTKSPEIIPLRGYLFSTKCKELQSLDGQTVALRSQSAEVLATLAARAGEIVSKDEIIAAVWADTFVTDDSLVQCIADIRRALGDTTHEIVETFTKRGYRLNIDPVGRVASAARNDTTLPAGGTRRRTIVVSLVAAVALVAVALAFLGNRLQPE